MKGLAMYIQIQELKANGFSRRKAAEMLGICRNTVADYWNMTGDDYTALAEKINKCGMLANYESVILDWLYRYPSMSSAQIFDWLQEHYKIEPSERTVRRYVSSLREDHNIRKSSAPRTYEAVADMPPGHQMQIDFGASSMRLASGQYVKVYFIGVVLSCSRYKWGCFLDRPFRSADLSECLDRCFEYLGGTCKELVFDQDSIVAVSENNGDIIYTQEFDRYIKRHSLSIYLCRKSDPESKGKIESVVKFVKNNFLANRMFIDLRALNESFEAWLERTGNAKVHGTTKKIPAVEFEKERGCLRPVDTPPKVFHNQTDECRQVRKDNTILYESNRYTVPHGTFGKDKDVCVKVSDGKLIIEQVFGDYIIAEHQLAAGKGMLVSNSNHRRDREKNIDELYAKLSARLEDKCSDFLQQIRKEKRRYVRDQYLLLSKLIDKHGAQSVIAAAGYCWQRNLASAVSVQDAIEIQTKTVAETVVTGKPADTVLKTVPASIPDITTQKRNIGEYGCLNEVRNDF